jgi:hypothetical protein
MIKIKILKFLSNAWAMVAFCKEGLVDGDYID